jgi:hypothetical protein
VKLPLVECVAVRILISLAQLSSDHFEGTPFSGLAPSDRGTLLFVPMPLRQLTDLSTFPSYVGNTIMELINCHDAPILYVYNTKDKSTGMCSTIDLLKYLNVAVC